MRATACRCVLSMVRYHRRGFVALWPHAEHAAMGVWHGCHADGAGWD
jgi:hypothetical protein